MAQSMLMSTSVSGGRALPSLQSGRPAPYPRLALPSAYRHSRSVSVKTLALFGKSKAAPAKKVRATHACTLLVFVPLFCRCYFLQFCVHGGDCHVYEL